MLATVGTDVPAGADWVFEPKYDGIRILAFAAGRSASGKVALLSRNGLDKTKQFPEIVDALRALHAKVKRAFVIDGEIVAMHNGAPLRFQELQGRMHTTDVGAIERHRNDAPTALFVFDMLMDGRQSLVAEPWQERRKHLTALLHTPVRSKTLQLSDVSDDGIKMLRQAHRRGWEGIIAKRRDATYAVGKRSHAWIKLKIERRQEFVVGGWTEPRNSREHLGALLLGYYDHGKLIYAGHTGTGFDRASLRDMSARLSRIERKTSPFTTTPRTNAPAHWTRPDVVVEIRFNEWTADGKLRQPVFLGVRDDKPAREVVHEPESMVKTPQRKSARVLAKPRVAAWASLKTETRSRSRRNIARVLPMSRAVGDDGDRLVDRLSEIERHGAAGVIEVGDTALTVSNLDKVFFPDSGHTKGDVLRYYARVAPYVLAIMADRPLVLKRFPGGVTGPSFYQQRAPLDVPRGVRVQVVSDEGIKTQERLIGGDLATLLYVAQLGAVSIDPWHSRVGSIEYADYAIVDLDPGPRAPFARVVEVAHVVREVLDGLKVHGVPKTSGASGIHVALPLGPGIPNDGARMIAELVATLVVERAPRIATVERSVSARASGAVYVDYLQNIRGKTVAGVYSVRAQRTPTVSTPLRWDELTADLDPRAHTIDSIPERIHMIGDLWADGMRTPNTLTGIIGHG
jgi:bifunctional non-homologous end joining protein LigD